MNRFLAFVVANDVCTRSKQPFMETLFAEWNKIFKNMLYREKYGTPFPRDSVISTKK